MIVWNSETRNRVWDVMEEFNKAIEENHNGKLVDWTKFIDKLNIAVEGK